MLDLLSSIIWSTFGGAVYVLIWWKTKADVPVMIKHMLLAAVVGILYAQTGFPNSLNVFMAGYFSCDVFEFFVAQYKPKEVEEKRNQ